MDLLCVTKFHEVAKIVGMGTLYLSTLNEAWNLAQISFFIVGQNALPQVNERSQQFVLDHEIQNCREFWSSNVACAPLAERKILRICIASISDGVETRSPLPEKSLSHLGDNRKFRIHHVRNLKLHCLT